ncbi:Glycosyltransferase involved in cell wall bisynthesis [Flavobacteriaceae bacterium MAR_2010_188]|nr:Glycosyltransferase involved in cell wall bisynthesis [Flavobacteriaceae bacterium MAR_2010_188]
MFADDFSAPPLDKEDATIHIFFLSFICKDTFFHDQRYQMKILLIGEYSRLHNSLKEGLLALGHEVTLMGFKDHFKQFPVDIDLESKVFNHSKIFPAVKALNRLTGINLVELENAYRYRKISAQLKDFDVVQLINENSFKTYGFFQRKFIKSLKKYNDKLFLLACGIDYVSVKYAHDKKLEYSILTPLHQNPKLASQYKFILNKLNKKNQEFYRFILKNLNGIISSDLDYHLPYKGTEKYLGMISNPINSDKIEYSAPNITGKVKIFHGINSGSFTRKGNVFFEEVLEMLKQKYPNKVEVTETVDLSYKDYIKAYNDCHILLDQVYAYDQGYNALEAMSMGKVVFTGAEAEFLEYYKLTADSVCINAEPDVQKIFEKLEGLINNPELVLEISKNARKFIEEHHNYKSVARNYLETWNKN